MERTLRWLRDAADGTTSSQARRRLGRRCGRSSRAVSTPSCAGHRSQGILDQGEWTGIAIGGLSVGESKLAMHAVLEQLAPDLPRARPRYLMGVGFPDDLLEGIARGVDLFDCVAATRNGRHGSAWTSIGRVNVRGAALRLDESPLDADCDCECCSRFSRAYVRHLFVSEEHLGPRLVSIHNIRFLIRLADTARGRILDGTFDAWAAAGGPDTSRKAACNVGQGGMVLLIQIAAIIAVMYFLFIRPQAQARRKAEAMLAALKKGDEIMTAGGIIGKVRDIKESLITVETGTATVVVERSRIVRVGEQSAADGSGHLMAIRDIHILGSPVLRHRAEEIDAVDDDVRALVEDLFDTMAAASGVGLAANQIGVTRRVAVINADDQTFAMINPRIVEATGRDGKEEGCLSIPDAFAEVTRPERIVLEALDESGETIRMEAVGLVARAVQHELDHLDGVLFIDHLSPLKRQLLVSRWKKEHRNDPLTRTPVPEEPKADA